MTVIFCHAEVESPYKILLFLVLRTICFSEYLFLPRLPSDEFNGSIVQYTKKYRAAKFEIHRIIGRNDLRIDVGILAEASASPIIIHVVQDIQFFKLPQHDEDSNLILGYSDLKVSHSSHCFQSARQNQLRSYAAIPNLMKYYYGCGLDSVLLTYKPLCNWPEISILRFFSTHFA